MKQISLLINVQGLDYRGVYIVWLIIKNRTKEVLVTIYVLTIIDVISTIVGIKAKLMTEANVLMDHVFRSLGYEVTGIIILITVGCSLILLYKVKDKVPWLPAALMFILVIKILIVILHTLIWGYYAAIGCVTIF